MCLFISFKLSTLCEKLYFWGEAVSSYSDAGGVEQLMLTIGMCRTFTPSAKRQFSTSSSTTSTDTITNNKPTRNHPPTTSSTEKTAKHPLKLAVRVAVGVAEIMMAASAIRSYRHIVGICLRHHMAVRRQTYRSERAHRPLRSVV